MDQDYFPKMEPGFHYQMFREDFSDLSMESRIPDERIYDDIARNAKALYDDYMRPTEYAIGTAILKHIFQKIEEHTV